MNVQHKLEVFLEAALTEAHEKEAAITKETNEQFKEACEETTRAERKKAEERIRLEKEKLSINNISEAMFLSRKEVFKARELLINELFDAVHEKIVKFMETDEYLKYLETKIDQAIKKYGDSEIILMPKDMKFAKHLKSKLNISVAESKENFLGGFKAAIKGKNAIYDNTFIERFDEQRKQFNLFSTNSN